MFGLSRKTEEKEAVDFSASLQRALKNPLTGQGAGAGAKASPDLRGTLSAIEASFYVIDQIREVLVEASQLVLRAKDVADLAGRALLAEQYDELRQSVTQIVGAADADAVKLLGHGARPMSATLNGHSRYTVDPACLDVGPAGLDLPPPAEGFENLAEIAAILGHLEKALAKVDNTAGYYMKDAQFLISRLEK